MGNNVKHALRDEKGNGQAYKNTDRLFSLHNGLTLPACAPMK